MSSLIYLDDWLGGGNCVHVLFQPRSDGGQSGRGGGQENLRWHAAMQRRDALEEGVRLNCSDFRGQFAVHALTNDKDY